MAVRYVARYHSEDDPGGLIREVIELGADFPGPAGDVLLSWLLRLEAGKDPAEGACGELIGLLREVSEYGAERLERTMRPSRSRRGRSRRKR
jgi:hypothetical protein